MMHSIWNSCTFSEEIESEDFSKAKFAIALHEFLDGKAGPIYGNAERFFANTFPTDPIKLLLKETILRLTFGNREPVRVINTGFGGGKTHTILLLHHILNHPNLGLEFMKKILPKDSGISRIPCARMVAIDCTKISKQTLWGEIAYHLDEYEKFREYDEETVSIKNISLIISLLSKQPTLVLLDELPHYLYKTNTEKIGKGTLADLTIAFLMDLISATSSTDKSCLILTLTDKQPLNEAQTSNVLESIANLETLNNLHQAISRQADILTPVARSQIYDLVRTRLVRNVDTSKRDDTVREYCAWYEKNGIAIDSNFEDKLRRSYPFHPSLIDILHDRVSTISSFNQTRGMLRLLCLITRRARKDNSDLDLLGPADVQLCDNEISDELTTRLGLKLKPIIETDCIRHAQEIDDSKQVKVAEYIARTIYLFSLHNDSKKTGISLGALQVAMGIRGRDPAIMSNILKEDILNAFWYIRDRDMQEFYFVEIPNVNAIIHGLKSSVSQTEIHDQIERTLYDLVSKNDFRPVIWQSDELTDSEYLKIFLVDYRSIFHNDDEAISYMDNILNYMPGDKFREYKNTVVFVYANPDVTEILEEHARTLLAIRRAKKNDQIKANNAFLKQTSSKESAAKHQLDVTCRTTYSKIAYPCGPQLRLDELHMMDTQDTITDSVKEILKNKGKLISENVSPDAIQIPDAGIVKISEIRKNFLKDTSQPFILNLRTTIDTTIRNGIESRRFGYYIQEQKIDGKYVTVVRPTDITSDGFIVKPELIYTPPGRETKKNGSSSTCSPSTEFAHKVHFPDFASLLKFTTRVLPFLHQKDEWKDAAKKLHADVTNGSVTMSIDCDLKEYTIFNEILSRFQETPDGSGNLTIKSKTDLQKMFEEREIPVETETIKS